MHLPQVKNSQHYFLCSLKKKIKKLNREIFKYKNTKISAFEIQSSSDDFPMRAGK